MVALVDQGALIKAKMMNNDDVKYNTQRMLDRDIIIRQSDSDDKVLSYIKRYQALPWKFYINLVDAKLNEDKLTIFSKHYTFNYKISALTNFLSGEFFASVDESVSDSVSEQIEGIIPLKTKFISVIIDNNGIISYGYDNFANTSAILDENEYIGKYYHIKSTQNVNDASLLDLTKYMREQYNCFFKQYQFPHVTNATKKSDVVGIDFGTTRCCAAVIRSSGKSETVALDNRGQRLLPSYVSFSAENTLCGQIVIDRLIHAAKYSVFDVKRIYGKNISTLQIDKTWPFKIIADKNRIKLQLESNTGTIYKYPEDVSAFLLKHIKEKASDFQGKELTEAIITVPTAFNDEQNDAIYASALLAEWKIIHLIPEPVAAAFAYFIENPMPDNSTILLFDLGGGTLDVCIFKIDNDGLQICARNGDPHLGGRDFDNILAEYFIEILDKDYNIKINDSKRYRLMSECQTIKETLSEQEDCSFDVENYDRSQEDCYITITRKDFENLAKDLLDKILTNIIAAVEQHEAKDIDKILYVGGGSRMPMIKSLLERIFPIAEHCCARNPEEVVAVGAAYYSYHLHSNQKERRCSIM